LDIAVVVDNERFAAVRANSGFAGITEVAIQAANLFHNLRLCHLTDVSNRGSLDEFSHSLNRCGASDFTG